MKKVVFILLIIIAGFFIYNKYQWQTVATIHTEQLFKQQNSLVLVNKDSKLSLDSLSLIKLDRNWFQNVTLNDTFYVSEQMVDPLKDMFEAAKKDGINHFIINSAYRSAEEQAEIYQEKGSSYALPAGYSEHETGLAIDIGSIQGLAQNSEEGKWLEKNAPKYGFVLRYPAHKEAITQISYEAWHFRYVGLPHSLIMEENDMVLEEYIAWLEEEREIQKKIKGVKYVIRYFDFASLADEFPTANAVTSQTVNDAVIVTSIQ